MADRKSVKLLPEFLQTAKNQKFLSSTIDQLIEKPQLERLDGYVGSKQTPTYSTSDIYISEISPLRSNYQLDPSLVISDSSDNIKSIISLEDLVNEINYYGGSVDNFDRLFRTDFYKFDPYIDWDKLVNYQNYYWLPTGPGVIDIMDAVNVEADILGAVSYHIVSLNVDLVNGMMIKFTNPSSSSYLDKEFFVEGVGRAIRLVDYNIISSAELISTLYQDNFDSSSFDNYPFDSYKRLPLTPDYLTINRSSADRNPWSRYNRWIHKDVIRLSAEISGQQPVYPLDLRAKRPVVEFNEDIKLYNFGTNGIDNVDLIDTQTTDVFRAVEGSAGHHADGVLLEQGYRVMFLAATEPDVKGKIYQVNFITVNNKVRLTLREVASPNAGDVTVINYGNRYAGTSWWYDGSKWVYAQQHSTLNQAPLFDLFDNQGYSYSDTAHYTSNFSGNQIFNYDVGTGTADPVLGFPLKYKNSVGVGSYLFKNYFTSEEIFVAQTNQVTSNISTALTYFKVGNTYRNVWTQALPYAIPKIANGYYDLPLGLTNNPLNGALSSLTLSDIRDHVSTSHRLISNVNPLPFAQMFLGNKEHSIIDALTKSADHYNQFKFSFLKKIAELDNQIDSVQAVDVALKDINTNKTIGSPYQLSDMVPYGTDYILKSWTVSNAGNKIYPLDEIFNLNELSLRAVLIYINNVQLVQGKDYEFISNDSFVKILATLSIGDILTIKDYKNTEGNYVPPTPTKLGLYPKFTPAIYTDSSYLTPTTVIQGHDGSTMVAYNDYRDAIILEYETRIYNNIKANYNSELLDINSVLPGAWRTTDYSLIEVNNILEQDFIKWAGKFAIDYTTNSSFNDANPFTYNYTGSDFKKGSQDTLLNGSWRAIFKYFYDTDRPNTHPWEMLGFSEEPSWWVNVYGPPPYDSTNNLLLSSLIAGKNIQTETFNPLYARLNISHAFPNNNAGGINSPIDFASNYTPYSIRQNWKFGDWGPAETAWRRSSYWPFAVQKLLALTKPATYAALMYDPIRIQKNPAGQWVYDNKGFLNLSKMPVQGLNGTLTSGYSVYVSEIGRLRNANYNQELSKDLANIDLNLFYKVGGFINKTELQIIIDAYEPTTTSPGAVLQPEDYSLILNISNPVKSTAISGIIVQKNNGRWLVKGYDTRNSYFETYNPVRNSTTPSITVGGISQSYLIWAPSTTSNDTGLSTADTTSASSSISGTYYQQGQIVSYNNHFYVVKISHRSGSTFDSAYFQKIPSLPVVGGVAVQVAIGFDKTSVNNISYGTEFDTIQEVYDLIIGYGAWLEDQGFSFNQYNVDLQATLNWDYSAKEFLYWTTQNWADKSLIALSPFADQITFTSSKSVVDNIFDSFYEYSLLQANAVPYPKADVSVTRDSGICTIKSTNPYTGIYFARLNSVQKEHAIVFNNRTIFNDTIYNVETGYKQARMKLVGFRTANWNGDYFSPGFVYDTAVINDWQIYTDYRYGDIVRFGGKYYSAKENINGTSQFNFSVWSLLGSKPIAALIPNFDYKINQFEDFYSLDIDNFDYGQQKAAQHLTGYIPRVYLNNVFTNPVAQYKFYQGFIREKGTKNSISKLSRATIQNLKGEVSYNEEWAFRVGYYGSYSSFNELELSLTEGTFRDNPQILKFVDSQSTTVTNLIKVILTSDLEIKPLNYQSTATFVTTNNTDIIQLKPAGYVRIDDVDFTAFNQADIANFTNTNFIKEGATIWVANTLNHDWDVLRYSLASSRLIEVDVDNTVADQYNFFTDSPHGLSVGEIVSISEFDADINGIYTITSVPSSNEFTIINSASTIVSSLKPAAAGLIFKFDTARYSQFDDLPSDSHLRSLPYNSKVWIDNNGSNNWEVYQKLNNYKQLSITAPVIPSGQTLGWNISKNKTASLVMVGNPGFIETYNQGNVFVYLESNNQLKFNFRYGINENINDINYDITLPTGFGQSVVYDNQIYSDVNGSTGYGIMFVGAPLTSHYQNLLAEIYFPFVEHGLVKISTVDPVVVEEKTQALLVSPSPSDYERFGSSLFLMNNADGSKMLFVGAPQTPTVGVGTVYVFQVNTSTTSVSTGFLGTVNIPEGSPDVGSRWGTGISGTSNSLFDIGKGIVAISAPGYSSGRGIVAIYTGTDMVYSQTILSPFGDYANFGSSIILSPTGKYLLISALNARELDQSYGKVAVYQNNSGTYELLQIISNPVSGAGMKFGQDVDINEDEDELVISAIGTNRHIVDTFDEYSELDLSSQYSYVNDFNSTANDSQTTYDSDSTSFFDQITYSGTVYVYNRKNNLFKLADEFVPHNTSTGTNFGFSLSISNDKIFIGAPAYENAVIPDTANSAFYQYYKIDNNKKSWNLLRSQDVLVQVDTIQKVSLIDISKDEVVDYLDVIDPIKGKIAGIAEQEIKYKSSFDPAIYSVSSNNTVSDLNTNWLDDQVGEIWWDLSSVKYVWYEQGEEEYRKSYWGSIFPGSSIDVYEWVGSTLLPSQWAVQADTTAGLTNGISGQPKYSDNSNLSVKQVYNPLSGTFTNYYYYWVKNSVIVPNSINRRISSYEIAQIILDPKLYGLRYLAIISSDAIAVANVNNLLVGQNINLNISSDVVNNNIPKHTEWLLLQEGSEKSPPALLEKKLIDSLLGHDSIGNEVPDSSLKERSRYGIEIRPRQSMFKNRLSALRNVFDFVNSVLLNERVTGVYSFNNLNKQEEIPSAYLNEYDQIVEDNAALLEIDTRQLQQKAELSCTVNNGKISSVSILNPGFGYKTPPTVEIVDNKSSAIIETVIDINGRIIKANIINSGFQFSTAPALNVRPYTVIVLADDTYNGKWTKFIWDYSNAEWTRVHTQLYNTTLYWNYVDWSHTTYNKFLDYTYTVNHVYEVSELSLVPGQYVKVKNGGLGYYIILEKTAAGVLGTFDADFNIVYAENGTIQISNSIWDYANNNLGYDYNNSYDQTLYDQSPDLELEYLMLALKNDIFINNLKSKWNLMFFRAVKYALSEQKLLDWAFKTSFIDVTNFAGNLGQLPIYKLLDTQYYEDYIAEAKPYHTQIRNFTTNYSLLEPTETYTTDFDLPSVYNQVNGIFTTVGFDSELISVYPWKSWADNYQTTGTVRNNLISLRFDRNTRAAGINPSEVTDIFVCDGNTTEFVLSWAAQLDKKLITVTLNDELVLSLDYKIVVYKSRYNGYLKKYTKIQFNNYIPPAGEKLKITYQKSLDLLSAADRILNYYKPTSGMPGVDLPQLMSGIEYPGTRVEGIPFSYNTKWDMFMGYDTVAWEDQVTYYNKTTSTSQSIVINGLTHIMLYDISHVSPGQYVNVISTTTAVFSRDDITVISVDTNTNIITLSTTTLAVVPTGSTVEFWDYNSIPAIIDSEIIGGDVGYTQAKGTALSDIILDGDGFITPETSYAPEELVPGEVHDTLGINVYTKGPCQSPIIVSSSFDVVANATTYRTLSITPPGVSSIIVSFNHQIFSYNTDTNFTSVTQFTIDWTGNSGKQPILILPPQPVSGKGGYTVVSEGGVSTDTQTGFIDSGSVVTSESVAQVVSLSGMNTVKSAYVTVNGQPINRVTTSTEYGYMIVPSSAVSNRAAVEVYNLPTGLNAVSAWFFGTSYTYFNQIREQVINVNSYGPITQYTEFPLALEYPPRNIKPEVANAIVEFNNSAANSRRALVPPHVDYYRVTSPASSTFEINDTARNGSQIHLDLSRVRVYVNGEELKRGFDYTFDTVIVPNKHTVTINSRLLAAGDVVAILCKPGSGIYDINDQDYEYDIVGSYLSLCASLPASNPATANQSWINAAGWNSYWTGEIKVITYTDHDGMLMRTETFKGNPTGRYKISRPVFNDNYIWVYVNGIPLSSFVDYTVLGDGVTVQVVNAISFTTNDEVTIITFGTDVLTTSVLGYRIFNDLFNRTQFKRLSKKNTTFLTKGLLYTDTEIHVNDSSVLTPPLVARNIPGVINIDGERIEFFTIKNNVLGQLRRGTLGTSPKYYNEEYTKVIDQSPSQTVPYTENIRVQNYLTSATVNTYVISTISNTATLLSSVVFNDGIQLSLSIDAINQISVYYGGRLLNKAPVLHHDINSSYDSQVLRRIGSTTTFYSTSSTSGLPYSGIAVGTPYIIKSNNQIWVYEKSKEIGAINGFVYKGLTYQPEEFSVNTATQEITLNIPEGIQDGVKLTIVKKDFSTSTLWNNGITLLDSTTPQAKFLQKSFAELPDSYYYGGDPQLYDDSRDPLVDDNNSPLLGL